MNDIQKARDVLNKWRADSNTWKQDAYGEITSGDGSLIAGSVVEEDAHLIIGTAGNPDLLDAMDTLLEQADVWVGDPSAPNVATAAELIAAAIIAAEERMQQ